MSVETLENLLKNPDIWDISLSTQNMHDVLVEIASRVDALMVNQDKSKSINNDNEQQTLDINDFNSRIDALSKQLDRQNTDFGSEIQDLRALFNFQIRDVREKIDRSLSSIKDSISRPSTPPPTVIQQIPDTDANFEVERKLHSLSKDISNLKDRTRTILKVLKDLPELQNKANPEEDNKSPTDNENKNETDPTSSTKLVLDNEPDVDLLSQSSKINPEDPLSPSDTPFSTSRIKDSRFDDIVEDIEFMKKERKNDVERLNSTIKAVNQLIAEKDNSTNKINQCARDSKRFGDEFDRLYQKMAEFQVEVDKKINEALNLRINSDIKSIASSSNNQTLELPVLKEGISDDLAQLDNSYKQQINYLKLEIAQLRQELSDRMLLPQNNQASSSYLPSYSNDMKNMPSRSDVHVQTDESLSDAIPTRHANVDVQKTRIANEIMTQVIVSRTPIQYMAINQDYVNMMKRFQQTPQQQPSQQPAEKPKPVKRQRKPVSTSSIEIQTNDENSKDQSDTNQMNEDDPRNASSSSSSKAGSSSKKMRSSHSSRKVTYIDSTTETQAEISGVPSPLRTPPRTPLRSQNQKRKAVLIDILIETDPEITGETLGITPDMLEYQESSRANQNQDNESDSEEEEEKGKKDTESPIKVDSETSSIDQTTKNETQKKKKRKGKKAKNSQNPNDLQPTENNQKQKEGVPSDSIQVDNSGKETKAKTPTSGKDKTQINQKENESKNEKESETKTENKNETQQQQQQKDQTNTNVQIKTETSQSKPEQPKESDTTNSEKSTKIEIDTDSNTSNNNKHIARKKEKVIYADSGISTQINTYEKEIIDRGENSEDGDEVEVVDIEIQTDAISEEELNMYSIFNQESDPDLLKEMGVDMSYMEKYSTSGANTKIGLGNQSNQNQQNQIYNSNRPAYNPQNYIFSFEHLLNLTIISESNYQEPQKIIVQVPEGSNATENGTTTTNLADIQSIVDQCMNRHKDKNIESLNNHVKEHTKQIGNIFNILDDLRNTKTATPKRNEQSESNDTNNDDDNNRIGDNQSSSPSKGSRAGTSNSNNSSNNIINNSNNSSLSPDHQTRQQDQQQPNHQLQLQNWQQPGSTPSNPVFLIADLLPDPQFTALQQNAIIPSEVNERFDDIDDAIADLEDHVFALEKKLIDKGALRPNTSDPYGEPGDINNSNNSSPFGPKIQINANQNQAGDYWYRESNERRHHHHRHRHNNNNEENSNNNGENRESSRYNESARQQESRKESSRGDENQPNSSNQQDPNATTTSNNLEGKGPEESGSKVVSISSGPDKPRSNYYTQYTPGSLSKERELTAKKETLEFIQGFTIDPDPESMKPPETQVVIPEDLTLPKYERQLRLLREAVVELRTNIQILRVKTDQPVIIQPTENIEPEKEKEKENTVDEQTLRALRKKIELTFEDYASQIADIRRELYLHLEQPPDRIIEVRTEVQTIEKPKEDEDANKQQNGKPAPQAPKDINVDLNLSKAIEMLADTQHKSVISIHKIELPPEVKEHKDLVQRIQQNNPIIEDSHHQNGQIKPTSDLLQPPPTNENNNINGGGGNQQDADQNIDYSVLPPPASTPLITSVKNEGHFVPQIVQDMRVLNAMPKKDMLELLMPFLYQLRSELLLNIDSNAERIRCLENSVQSKVEKEFIESFFRKIRMAVKEADDKAMKACNSLFDKVSKQDLEDRVQELLKQIGTQETTVAGKTSYTCLFCGAKKTVLSKSSAAMDKGKIFKGRATRQSLQSSDLSQLPPLSENE